MPRNPVTGEPTEFPVLYRNAFRVRDDGTVEGRPAFRTATYYDEARGNVTVALDPETLLPATNPVYPGPTYTGTAEHGPRLWNTEQHYGLLELGEEEWDAS